MNDEDLLGKYGLLVQSEAPKKAKTETDELLAKYGLTDEAAPTKSKDDAWWKNQNIDPSYEGIAKRLGVGFVRGAKDVLDSGAHGLANTTSFIADKVLPKDLADKIKASATDTVSTDKTARDEFNTQYPASDSLIPNATDVGRFAGQAAATAPLMPTSAMTGIAAASNALPTVLVTGGKAAAPIANRLVAAAGQGGLGGAIMGAGTASTNDKSLAENIGENALGGSLAGPALTAGASLAKNVAGRAVGRISPERAELARKAADHDINLEAGQVSTSPTFKKFNQVSGWLPFSGAKSASEKQINQFNAAVSRTFGEDTSNITPQVLQKAKQRIGSDYDTVAANTTVKVDNQLINNFAKTYQDAESALDDNQFKIFKKQLELLASKFQQGNGEMGGDAWQAFRHINSSLSRVAGGKDSDLGYFVKNLKVAMDGAFNRSAPDDMQALLKNANSQYKSMKTIEKLANSDAEGQVSPLKLMQKVVTAPGGKEGAGKLGELADIGRAFFPQPADSGTPLGEAILSKVGGLASHPISGLGTAAASIASGAPLMSVAEGGLGLAANAGLRRAINSRAVTNSMLNSAEGANYGAIDSAVQKAIPYTGPNLGPLQEKRERRAKLPVALTE